MKSNKNNNADDEIVKLKYDTIFKMFFCSKDNEHLLRSFLARVLEVPYESISKIEIVNSELTPDEEDEKFGRLDINLEVDGKKVNIEIQFRIHANFKGRSQFYWAKMYTGSLKKGDTYDKLAKCICINIVNFNLFECEEYHSHFKVMEATRHEVLNDEFNIHFFELPKLGKTLDGSDPLKLWMQLINAETKEELDMLEQTNVKEIQEATLIIRKMSEDERAKELSRLREKRIRDEASELKWAREQGIAEGRAEGEAKGRAEERQKLADNLRNMGMPEDQIKLALG